MIETPHIIAHRGASSEAPENTIAAFRVAGARHAKWIECDVTLSSDDKCVIIHDDTLERTTNGTGIIRSLSENELCALDAGSWFSDVYKGERIPTLHDTLETLFYMDMGINLEIKPSGCDVNALCQAVSEELAQSRPLPILLSSFEEEAVRIMRKLTPALPCGWLLEELPENWKSTYDDLDASAIHIDHEKLSLEQCREILAENMRVICYTVNDIEKANELFTWGVHAVITDDPAKMIAAFPTRPEK